MREFGIAHVSDLHITLSGSNRCSLLRGALLAQMDRLAIPKPWVLVVTGDIVETPTARAVRKARVLLEQLSEKFDDRLYVPGNHDRKRFFGNWLGVKTADYLFMRHSALLPEASAHIVAVDSTQGSFARGRITSDEYDRLFTSVYEPYERGLTQRERRGLLRIAAVHHHPLPIAAGEDRKLFGLIDDERFMYLKNPARFLQACISHRFEFVLHGHRHVPGLVKYSLEAGRDDWRALYVLSCASSTGKGSEGWSGFNVLRFRVDSRNSHCNVWRFVRRSDQGDFSCLEDAGGELPLCVTLDETVYHYVRNALQSIRGDPGAAEGAVYPLLGMIFQQREFRLASEIDWHRVLLAIAQTSELWAKNVMPRLRSSRRPGAEGVSGRLAELCRFLCGIHGISEAEFIEDMQYVDREDQFLARLPNASEGRAKAIAAREALRSLLLALRGELLVCDVNTQVGEAV